MKISEPVAGAFELSPENHCDLGVALWRSPLSLEPQSLTNLLRANPNANRSPSAHRERFAHVNRDGSTPKEFVVGPKKFFGLPKSGIGKRTTPRSRSSGNDPL